MAFKGTLRIDKKERGSLKMRLSKHQDLIKIEFQYDPNTVSAVKRIPDAFFHRDPLGAYWTIPISSLKYAFEQLSLSPGSLYPDLLEHLPPGFFNGLKAELKPDRMKIQGKTDWMIRSLDHLCEVEYKEQNTVVTHNLGNLIYNKNDVAVYQFPSGLYWRILNFLRLCKVNIIVHPCPGEPEPTNLYDIAVTGRPYQNSAVQQIATSRIPNRATLVMTTGAGKTILSAMITAKLGLNTIFYTYSTDLLEQTAATYEKLFGCEIGRISSTNFNIQPITIAMIQTVHSCLLKKDDRWQILSSYLDEVDLMFIDEGHMLGAETIFAVAQATDTHYAYALTATPFREDGKELYIEAATGPAVELVSEQELIKGGYVLPVVVETIPVRHDKYKGKRYSTLYKNQIVKNSRRNQIICQVVQNHGDKKVLVLVKEIAHGETLCEMLGATFIHGISKSRKEVIQSFAQGDINILIATSILKQGIDLPEAEVLVLAHGGTSQVELLQKIGRVRRPYPGKLAGIIVDFQDYCPTITDDIFKQQSQKRMALYNKQHFQIRDMLDIEENARFVAQ